ncbi:MAG: aldo/keto reductase [Synergistaceae bacterium]|nr:aldo/keto reductase [Synergistaceae bacterium]
MDNEQVAVKAGKVRAIGLSNFDINEKLFDDVLAKAEIKPSIVQIELHPYAQRKSFRDKCAKNNIAVEGWYPLGGTHGGKRFFTSTWEEIQRFNDWKPED